MRVMFATNGDYFSMTLLPDSQSEKHLLEAFGASTLPITTIDMASDGLRVSRRATAPPTEETGNTK